MKCIRVNNVNQGLAEGLRHILHHGVDRGSRNGGVLRIVEPVTTHYDDPTARVLFSPLRDANPYFHLMEGLWMLAGRNDVAFPQQFNSNFGQFSDDGRTFHGAYGYRWRQHFKLDQLNVVAEELIRRPASRRAVLQMWDAPAEWAAMAFGDAKDVPCNTQVYFEIQEDRLNMMVTCRSNDIWWGCYGANAVHFSMLQEYMAALIGVPVGWYEQMSFNFHLYPDKVPALPVEKETGPDLWHYHLDARESDLYTMAEGPHQPRLQTALHPPKRVAMVDHPIMFMSDCEQFVESPGRADNYSEPFILTVARPMYESWRAFKNKDYHAAEGHAENIAAGDWSIACREWLERRQQRRLAAKNLEA